MNNAGIMPTFAPVEWTPIEAFEGACKVNLFGTISVSLKFLPLLRQTQGRLVNVSSVTSTCAYPGIANYVISKAGVKMFSTCLRYEFWFNYLLCVHKRTYHGYRKYYFHELKTSLIVSKNMFIYHSTVFFVSFRSSK